MTSQKASQKPIFYSKSPFLTVSESMAAQMIEDTKQKILISEDKPNIRSTKRENVKFRNAFDYDGTISDLREDIDVLDVTIEDLRQHLRSLKDEQDLKNLIRSRIQLQESLETIQIEAVNKMLEHD